MFFLLNHQLMLQCDRSRQVENQWYATSIKSDQQNSENSVVYIRIQNKRERYSFIMTLATYMPSSIFKFLNSIHPIELQDFQEFLIFDFGFKIGNPKNIFYDQSNIQFDISTKYSLIRNNLDICIASSLEGIERIPYKLIRQQNNQFAMFQNTISLVNYYIILTKSYKYTFEMMKMLIRRF